MPNIVEVLRDDAILHQHYIERYLNGVVSDVLALLNDMARDAREMLLATDGELTRQRLDQILTRIDALADQYRSKINKAMGIQELFDMEVETQIDTLKRTMPIRVNLTMPAPQQLLSTIIGFDGSHGMALGTMLDTIPVDFVESVKSAIRGGYAIGKTLQDISRDVFGVLPTEWKGVEASQSPGVKRALLAKARKRAESVTRTALSHLQSQAKRSIYEDNNDIIKGYEWNAALDKRTCPICANLDGKTWFFTGEGTLQTEIYPPVHPRCRCTTFPITKTYKELGIKMADRPKGGRVSMDGYIPDYTTYADWFSRQAQNFQLEFLGKTRFELYKRGEFKVSDYADLKDMRIIPIREVL